MRKSLLLFAMFTLPLNGVLAQQAGPSDKAAAMKQTLLNPSGFHVDWNCGGSKGRSHVIFREEDQKIVIDVNNFSRGSCKSEAKLNDTGLRWDGCRDPGIGMVYASGNKDVPFKGHSDRCAYAFKSK